MVACRGAHSSEQRRLVGRPFRIKNRGRLHLAGDGVVREWSVSHTAEEDLAPDVVLAVFVVLRGVSGAVTFLFLFLFSASTRRGAVSEERNVGRPCEVLEDELVARRQELYDRGYVGDVLFPFCLVPLRLLDGADSARPVEVHVDGVSDGPVLDLAPLLEGCNFCEARRPCRKLADDGNALLPLRPQSVVVALAVLHERELFLVRVEDEVVHAVVRAFLVRETLSLEGSFGDTIRHVHLFGPVPEVVQASQPRDRLRHVRRFFRQRPVDGRDELLREQDLFPTEGNGYDAEDLVDDDMRVADHEKENTDLLHPACCHKPRTHREHDVCFVLARGVIEQDEEHVRVVAVVTAQPADAFPDHRPDQVGAVLQSIVRDEWDEAIAEAIRRRELEPPLWQCSRRGFREAVLTRIEPRKLDGLGCHCITADAPHSRRIDQRLKAVVVEHGPASEVNLLVFLFRSQQKPALPLCGVALNAVQPLQLLVKV